MVIEEVRLLTGRLENAGVFRSRLDPQTAPVKPSGRKRTLTELAGLGTHEPGAPIRVRP